MSSPTSRSLDYCRKRDWLADVVEHFNTFTKRRHDLYGFGDVLVIDDKPGLMAVQATSASNLASRMTKLSDLVSVRRWLAAGLRVECWGWSKRKLKRGGKAMRWTLRRVAGRLDGSMVAWDEVAA